MATLAQQYTQSNTASILQQGRMAMLNVAATVVSETYDVARLSRWTKRHELAVSVLRDPDYYTPRFVQVAIAMDIAAGYSTDALIISAMNQAFDKIAGTASNE